MIKILFVHLSDIEVMLFFSSVFSAVVVINVNVHIVYYMYFRIHPNRTCDVLFGI